jgi:hypothetical protein
LLQSLIGSKMAPKEDKDEVVTLDNLEATLSKDTRVKLAGVDVDGAKLRCLIVMAD